MMVTVSASPTSRVFAANSLSILGRRRNERRQQNFDNAASNEGVKTNEGVTSDSALFGTFFAQLGDQASRTGGRWKAGQPGLVVPVAAAEAPAGAGRHVLRPI
jgi:hypothetical protein